MPYIPRRGEAVINIRFIQFVLFSACLLILGCNKPVEKLYAENIKINDCWFESKNDWPLTECGVLTVPENYNKPEGRKIELPFIIVKSKVPNNKTYPLVVAGGGGPGGRLGIAEDDRDLFSNLIWDYWYYSSIDVGRDLVLIDNRGVGSSIPKLNCPEVETADMSNLHKRLQPNELIELTKKSFSECRQRLIKQGIDVSQYHVINAAKDLEQLRIGLNVDQLNVYGISYGTRVSLVYERLYPDSVRALILDGVYPLSRSVYEDTPRLYSEAIMRVIDKCEDDERCLDRFGDDLDDRLLKYLEDLNRSPIIVKVTSPLNYDPIEVLVTPDVLFVALFMALYSDSSITYIPKYLRSILKGNTDYLTELVRDYYVAEMTAESFDVGAYASYSCFDQIPFIDYALARKEINKYPFQNYSNVLVLDVVKAMCEAWDVPALAADFMDTYKIDTPLLLYSGELDPVTPSEMTKPITDNAKKSWGMEWRNIAHGVMFVSECADWTAERFLSDPESDPFIYECSDEEPEFKFVVR